MPINRSTFIMYDYETGSRNPNTTQAIQLAAIAIEPRNLEIIPDSEFESLIKPIFDEEECKKLEIDPLEDGALQVNGKTREELKDAPASKVVWDSFTKYCKNYNPKGTNWDAPILVGFNNLSFDDKIMERMAKEWGPWNEERQCCSLFSTYWKPDLMQMLFPWFESYYDLKSISMDNMRKLLGIKTDKAHDALEDVKNQAAIFCQLMKITRKFSKTVTWQR